MGEIILPYVVSSLNAYIQSLVSTRIYIPVDSIVSNSVSVVSNSVSVALLSFPREPKHAAMDKKVLCRCPKCTIQGGKFVSPKTVVLHTRENSKLQQKTNREMAGFCETAKPNPMKEGFDKASTRPLYAGSSISVLQAVTMLLSIQGLFPGVRLRCLKHHLMISKCYSNVISWEP